MPNDEIALHELAELTQLPNNFLSTHYEVDFTGTADEQKILRSRIAESYLKSNPKVAALVNAANPSTNKQYFFAYVGGQWVLQEYQSVESGLKVHSNGKIRLGGLLLENTLIDGNNQLNFSILRSPAINFSAADGTYNSYVRLDENGVRIAASGVGDVAGSLDIDGTQVLLSVNSGESSIKLDQEGVYLQGIADKTTETKVLYIDPSTGKMSKGDAPSNNGGFAVSYAKQIPFTSNQTITQASLETAFRRTDANNVLNGYYIGVFRCNQVDPLTKSATVGYQIGGQPSATLTVKHGIMVSFMYIDNVLSDVEVLTDSQLSDKIIALETEGVTGQKGDKGDKGDTGEPGAKGDKGDKGDPGTGGSGFGVSLVKRLQFVKNGTIVVENATASFFSENHWTVLDGYHIGICQCIGDFAATGTLQHANGVVAHDIFNGCILAFEYRNGILVGIDKLNDNAMIQVVQTLRGGEQDFEITSDSPSFSIWSRLVSNDVFNQGDLTASYDLGGKTLVFVNETLETATEKTPRFKEIEITVSSMSVVDSNGDLKIKLPRSFMRLSSESSASQGDEHKASYPRPRVSDVSSPSVSESTPFFWATDVNVPCLFWVDATHLYYKFVGLNQYDRVQLYLNF